MHPILRTYSLKTLRRAHLRFGQKGEAIARRLIKRLGIELLCRNFQTPYGEIDIVARDGAIICFIEVKSRRKSKRSRPADAVTLEKMRKIIRSAEYYLQAIGRPPVIYRFDIVEIVFDGAILDDCRYWANEFSSVDIAGRYKTTE